MRKLLTLLVCATVCVAAFGESFAKAHVELYKGKTIRVKKLDVDFGYSNFYSKFDLKTMTLDKQSKSWRLYPQVNNPCRSESAKLLGTEWVINNIYKEAGKKEYVFEITNGKTKAYYEYDPTHDFQLEFEVVGGLELPDDFYCEDLVSSIDKFTGTTYICTSPKSGITFTRAEKIADNGEKVVSYFIRSNRTSKICEVGKTGFYILLDNGQKIQRPEQTVDVEVNKYASGYVYSVFVQLTDEDIQLLLNNQITDTRAYVFDASIHSGDAPILQQYLKCLVNR